MYISTQQKQILRFASLAKKMQFYIIWYVDKITDAGW